MKRALNPWILIIFIVIGALLGNVIASLVDIDILRTSKSVGLSPTTLDLAVINISFGFQIALNLASVIGIMISVVFYKKFIQ